MSATSVTGHEEPCVPVDAPPDELKRWYYEQFEKLEHDFLEVFNSEDEQLGLQLVRKVGQVLLVDFLVYW